jgi:hypothetical protein
MPGVRGRGRAKRYDLTQVLHWLKQKWVGGTEPSGRSKRSAEIDLLVARRVHLELKTRIASGEFMDRAEVERGRCERITMVKAGLVALQRALAPAMLELDKDSTLDAAEALVWSYVEPLLFTFAGRKLPKITVVTGDKTDEPPEKTDRPRPAHPHERDRDQRDADDQPTPAEVSPEKGGEMPG